MSCLYEGQSLRRFSAQPETGILPNINSLFAPSQQIHKIYIYLTLCVSVCPRPIFSKHTMMRTDKHMLKGLVLRAPVALKYKLPSCPPLSFLPVPHSQPFPIWRKISFKNPTHSVS